MLQIFQPRNLVAGFLFCFLATVFVSVQGEENQQPAEPSDAKKTDSEEEKSFAHLVREDFFSGLSGNDEALQKAMTLCEQTLSKNPKHAEALAWRGAGRLFLSGKSFRSGDPETGQKYWTTGVTDLDKARELEPDNIGVLIPRAAAMMGAGRNAPPEFGTPLLKKVKADFEYTYNEQKDYLDQLGEHPLGELRMGLADVYRLLGESDKSKAQLQAVVKELPDTKYSKRATEWLAAPADKKLAHNCIGCHMP